MSKQINNYAAPPKGQRRKKHDGKPGVQIVLNDAEIKGDLHIKLKEKPRKYKMRLFRSHCPHCNEVIELTRQISDHGMSINHKCECHKCHMPIDWAELKKVKWVKRLGKAKTIVIDKTYSPPALFIYDQIPNVLH